MATAKTETTVTSVTLTLTVAEAEAVYALSGAVAGGTALNAPFAVGPERAAADAVFYALHGVLNKSVLDTTFYKSLNKSRRIVELEPDMPKLRKLMADSED